MNKSPIQIALEEAAGADHALLSASGAETWVPCPGSVAAQISLPDRSSIDSITGNVAHWLGQQCLELGKDAKEFAGMICPEYPDHPVTEEMVGKVQEYVDYCRRIPGKHHIETRVDFSTWVPGGFGTVDFFSVSEGVCYIVDLKFGKGVIKHAENNLQLILYALGVHSDFHFIYEMDTFKLAIHQPRLDHISEWEIKL